MLLRAKAIRISHAEFHCNRLTTVQDVQDYASLIFLHIVYVVNHPPRQTCRWMHYVLDVSVRSSVRPFICYQTCEDDILKKK